MDGFARSGRVGYVDFNFRGNRWTPQSQTLSIDIPGITASILARKLERLASKIRLPLQAPIMDELHRHDLTGKRVLDIGCRNGLFSFEAEKMGASEVVGIDNDLSPGATEFLIPYFNSKVQMRAVNKTDEPFDFVLFAGVLYHLRFPFLGLKKIADAMKPGATLIIENSMLATRDNPCAALLSRPGRQPS
jgi:2-polyprenyl-3-methyl-5-hydroxy-6-metoxy-1,4-benzoquinol methylase